METMLESQHVERIVRLVLPPHDRHVRTARLVAADAATRAGLDCDETDDLRIAVDEVCHALLRRGGGSLSLAFEGDPQDGVRVDAWVDGAPPAGEDDLTAFTTAVLGWVADSFDVTDTGGRFGFVVSKRHDEGAGCTR
jgi:histidine kinase-like protein